MKAITLHQPWASLVACKMKRVETRSWSTSHIGPLAIHASKSREYLFLAHAPGRIRGALAVGGANPDDLPTGVIVATCFLAACIEIVDDRIRDFVASTDAELSFGDFTLGHYAWCLSEVNPLDPPVPARGHQRLWEWFNDETA